MNNRASLLLWLAPLLLVGCVDSSGLNEFSGDPLPSCGMEGTPFENEDFAEYGTDGSSPEYRWGKIYNDRLEEILDEYEQSMLGTVDPEKKNTPSSLNCTAASYGEMLKAGPKLKALADELEAFEGRTEKLSSLDMTAVLVEWLRVYECSMHEHIRNATVEVEREFQEQQESGGPAYTEIGFEVETREIYVKNELVRAREMMDRLVTLVGGFSRLSPLAAELGCFERASADIRNSMSLLAEASACLPRALDVKGSLRDFSLQNE